MTHKSHPLGLTVLARAAARRGERRRTERAAHQAALRRNQELKDKLQRHREEGNLYVAHHRLREALGDDRANLSFEFYLRAQQAQSRAEAEEIGREAARYVKAVHQAYDRSLAERIQAKPKRRSFSLRAIRWRC